MDTNGPGQSTNESIVSNYKQKIQKQMAAL